MKRKLYRRGLTVNLRNDPDIRFTGVYHALAKAGTRYVVLYGGAGSSKSYSAHQNELINLMERSEGDTLVIRKYAADIRESCFKLFSNIINNFNLSSFFNVAYSGDNRRITFTQNGRNIVFRGIDDCEKLKSIVGIKRIIVEEASQLEFGDFLEINRRARGMEDIQITLILNPVSENHWIKTKLCDGPYAPDTTTLCYTYRDNRDHTGHSFLTDADIQELERLKDINENQYRIYTLAQWGIDNTESKFCWAFNHLTQVKPTVYDPERQLWASFDFNVNPLTCTLAQIIPEENTLRALECIKLENSDIWKMCHRLQASYPIHNWMWKFTGDATGKNRSAMVQDNLNYYNIIQQQFGINNWQQFDVPTANPPVEENRVLVNAVHKNWTVEIDPVRCAPLIYDLTYVEVNGRNEIMKDRTSQKKYADFLDTWRYLINIGVKSHFDFWKNK